MTATHETHGHAPESHGAPASHDAHAHPTVRTYLNVFVILFIVTAAEVIAAQLLPTIGLAGLVIPSLLIMALAKGLLIVMYYMHLKSDSLWFSAPFAFGMVLAAGLLISMIGLYIVSPREVCTPELGKGCHVEASR